MLYLIYCLIYDIYGLLYYFILVICILENFIKVYMVDGFYDIFLCGKYYLVKFLWLYKIVGRYNVSDFYFVYSYLDYIILLKV